MSPQRRSALSPVSAGRFLSLRRTLTTPARPRPVDPGVVSQSRPRRRPRRLATFRRFDDQRLVDDHQGLGGRRWNLHDQGCCAESDRQVHCCQVHRIFVKAVGAKSAAVLPGLTKADATALAAKINTAGMATATTFHLHLRLVDHQGLGGRRWNLHDQSRCAESDRQADCCQVHRVFAESGWREVCCGVARTDRSRCDCTGRQDQQGRRGHSDDVPPHCHRRRPQRRRQP